MPRRGVEASIRSIAYTNAFATRPALPLLPARVLPIALLLVPFSSRVLQGLLRGLSIRPYRWGCLCYIQRLFRIPKELRGYASYPIEVKRYTLEAPMQFKGSVYAEAMAGSGSEREMLEPFAAIPRSIPLIFETEKGVRLSGVALEHCSIGPHPGGFNLD